MTAALIVGYGNPLRRDDGIGPRVAERFADHPGVRVVTTHQLVPELAEAVAAAERVVFVDATAGGGDAVSASILTPTDRPAAVGHAGDPGWLLGLAAAVYGRRPAAWLVGVPGRDFGFGDGLSPEAERLVEAAAGVIEGLLAEEPACTRSG